MCRTSSVGYSVRESMQSIAKATSSYNTADNDDDHISILLWMFAGD